MVGRLFVSLNEVLGTISHVVCSNKPVQPLSKPHSSMQSYQTATPLPEVELDNNALRNGDSYLSLRHRDDDY
jgi:hypothetical protein